MTSSVVITLAQINPIVGDLSGNRDKILRAWKDAPAETNLIAFPELALCGYPPEDLILKPDFLDQIEKITREIVKDSKNFSSAILLPLPWRHKGKTYNALHLIDKGKIRSTTYKHELPNYGVFDEKRIFESAPLPKPLKFRGTKLGIMICEDMWFPDCAKKLKRRGAQNLIVINASPFVMNKYEERLQTARERINETGLPLYYVNQIGGQDELVFDGGSFIMNEAGEITAQGKFFEEDIVTDGILETVPGEQESVYKALTLGLKDYVTKNNFPGIVLGLSGGVDSALAAVMAVDAIGPHKVHAIMMPSEFTSQASLDDAQELAENLGIKFEIISIRESFDTLQESLANYSGDVMEQNIQSRIRGLMLMAISNAQGKMVLSTGNKSEMAVGYATLYGDMNGGFNALKDVYKTQVYTLCRWRNHQDNIIPDRIITRAPSAELKPDQTDQDTLPPYETLDLILSHLIEDDMSLDEIAHHGFKRDIVSKVSQMLNRAEYKRRQAPPGTKITAKAFGRERRYPMTNKFNA